MPTKVLEIPALVVSLSANTYGTLVGGTTTVLATNDGDTSYVDLNVPPGMGYQLRVRFPATPVPGQLVATSLVTVTSGTQSHLGGASFAITRDVVPGVSSNVYYWRGNVGGMVSPFALPSGSYAQRVLPLQAPALAAPSANTTVYGGPGVEVVTKAMVEAGEVTYNPGYALFNDGTTQADPGTGFHTRITYVALRVEYLPHKLPPRRVYPRDDGLATSSTPRSFPASRAAQSSNRTAGGYL